MAGKQRISYVPFEDMTPEMQAEMERCAREGTPRPESSAVRAHVPAAFWFFANSWRDLFREGIVEHSLKELCRVYVSRTTKCEYCGNQRSEKGAEQGLQEGHYDELLNFESFDGFDARQKAALAYAEAIAWGLETDDGFWDRMYGWFRVVNGHAEHGDRLSNLRQVLGGQRRNGKNQDRRHQKRTCEPFSLGPHGETNHRLGHLRGRSGADSGSQSSDVGKRNRHRLASGQGLELSLT